MHRHLRISTIYTNRGHYQIQPLCSNIFMHMASLGKKGIA